MNVNQIVRNDISRNKKPLVTLITPVFNRANIIGRTLSSVVRLDFDDFEYIIVDDGSTDEIDVVVCDFMNKVSFPVTYIKKDNGGVHTARNAGVKFASGKFIYFLDSDDETLPNAISIFLEEWKKIEKKADNYFEVKARCILDNGKIMGKIFPDNINDLPWKKVLHLKNNVGGELVGFRLAEILKNNLWPEPEGITFVSESILWNKLNKTYKTWLINSPVQLYHFSNVSIGNIQKRNKQSVLNQLWNASYMLNDKCVFHFSAKKRLKTIARVNIFKKLLRDYYPVSNYKFKYPFDRFISFIIRPITFFIFLYYRKKRFVSD